MHFGWRSGAVVISLIAACCLSVIPAISGAAQSPEELLLARKIVARWHITGHGQIQEAYRRGLDVWEEHPDPRLGYFTVMITEAELAQLRQDGYQIEVIDPDYYTSRQTMETMVPNGGFRTMPQCVALMDSIHTAHPTITSARFALGGNQTTYQGNKLWAMKISSSPNADNGRPEVLIDGMHHAREPIGMEICLETMKRLTNGYGTDTLMTRLVDQRQIYFVPIVNPDGYQYNYQHWTSGGGMWRKNLVDNIDGSVGVDINRNYGYKWGLDNNGSSGVPSDETYRGTAAFSEIETQQMRDFVKAHHFVFIVNYHSFSDLWMWPWGYDHIYTPDDALFSAIGDSAVSFNTMTPQVSWLLYLTNGDSDDWNYGSPDHTKAYSFTPEVGTDAEGTNGNGFWPIPSIIPNQIARMQSPNFLVIDLADTPERIYPPATPTWVAPADTVGTSSYNLSWTDPGGLNAAVAFKLQEMFGPHLKTDNAEGGITDWVSHGFSVSTAQAVSGTHSYFGGATNSSHTSLEAAQYYHVQPHDTLRAAMWYDIEQDWDYAYFEVSIDGGAHFTPLAGNFSTSTNPHGQNLGNGITGSSDSLFRNLTFPLNAYAGQDVRFRISYVTDEATLGAGVYIDDIGQIQAYDSVVTLAPALAGTTFPVSGKSNGNYLYSLQATDAQGQKSIVTPPRKVTVLFMTRGDLDNNGVRNVMDVIRLIDYVFSGGPGAVVPGAEECNCTSPVNVMDIIFLIDHVFRNGPAPSCP